MKANDTNYACYIRKNYPAQKLSEFCFECGDWFNDLLYFEHGDWLNYLWMNQETYYMVLFVIELLITEQDTCMRKSVFAHERVTATM